MNDIQGQYEKLALLETVDRFLQEHGASLEWLAKELNERDTIVPMSFPDRETVPIKIETINGQGVVMTEDGAVIGKQVGNSVQHWFYQGQGPGRVTMFRATFVMQPEHG